MKDLMLLLLYQSYTVLLVMVFTRSKLILFMVSHEIINRINFLPVNTSSQAASVTVYTLHSKYIYRQIRNNWVIWHATKTISLIF